MSSSGLRHWIVGAGGFAAEVLHTARAAFPNPASAGLCFAVEGAGADGFMGLPVHSVDDIADGDSFAVAIGAGAAREKMHALLCARGAIPMPLHAPTAVIGREVALGAGSVLSDFTMLTGNLRVGVQFQCNIYSYVAHDCRIGDYVTFAPKVCCNGNVHIGDHAYVGTGAILKQGTPDQPLRIGERAVIGMGAVVTKDVPAGAVVVGNPARPLER